MLNHSKKKILLIFLFTGIITTLVYANIFWWKYEKDSFYVKFGKGIFNNIENDTYLEGSYSGSRISNGKDVFLYFIIADNILNNFKETKNFFVSQPEFKVSFLHPNIIGFFSYLTNDDIIKKNENIKLIVIGKKKILILLQIFIYYISLFFFFGSIKNEIGTKKSLLLIAFLSLEPTIMQWNISFMTESFFFSFLILFLTFLLKQKKIYYFFSGIFFGLAILQKFFIIYYIFFIFLYFFIKKKIFLSKEMIIFFIGIFLMLFTLIISNYLRSNSFYLSPMQSYLHFPQYFEYRLFSREKNITLSESQNILNNQNKSWIEANLKTNNEYERLKYYKHLNQNSLKTIFRNKYEFSKMILKSSMKIIMINPTQMWFNHTKYPDWKEFSKTEDFKYAFYIKLFYSLALYTICFIGIIKFNIKKNPSLFFLHLSFILYFIIFASVGLNERYFVSSIIFFALFFSSGLEKILVKFKFSNEKKK